MGKKGEKAPKEKPSKEKNMKQNSLKETPQQEKQKKLSFFRRLTMRTQRTDNSIIKTDKNPTKDAEIENVKNNKTVTKTKKVKETKPPKSENKKSNKKGSKPDSKNSSVKSQNDTKKINRSDSQKTNKDNSKSPSEKGIPPSPTNIENVESSALDGQKAKEQQDLKSPVKTEKTIKFAAEPDIQSLDSSAKPDAKSNGIEPVGPNRPEIPRRPSILKNVKLVFPLVAEIGDMETGERCGSRRPSDMVTMSSEKAAARRKTDSNNGAAGSGAPAAAAASNNEDSPNQLVYKKMEQIVEKMQDEGTGVPVKTVKSFMSKIPSVFTGSDLIMWMMKNLDVEDQAEALHVAHLMAAHGYFFPIDDHMLTVKNDNTFYRFQTPYFWPSNCWEPENTDYAVYLCKRTMQNKTRLELADYEAENLARLQKMFSRKWEFIFMQAEAQSKVDKKRDKLERKVLDSQERAFWDVHRPMPGCVNTTEVDIKKACRVNKPLKSSRHLQLGVAGGRISPSTSETDLASPTEAVKRHIAMLKQRLDRRNIKVSKVAEACISYFEQYAEYDPFFTPPELPNPWISDSPEYWEQERTAKDISARRVKRWAFSLQELLQDPIGREHFTKFLDKEFSGENLKFWEAVQQLKALPQKDVQDKVNEIWSEFLAPDASCPINVDAQSYETTKKNMENTDRWSFDVAAAHVYHLMKSDSYSRYLRSEMYKEFLNGSKKKTSVKGIRSIVSFSARKETATS